MTYYVFRPQIAAKKILLLLIATKKIIIPRIAIVRSLNLTADCQGVIPVVANRGTFESDLTIGVIPVVANRSMGVGLAITEI
jgi:hypothetical protein